jgi:glycosyltransferase involved in cell wall biosynthesis
MKILYIWDADYPWDIRVEKICVALIEQGHEVHIAARNLKKLAQFEEIKRIKVHRLRVWKSDKINYFLSFPAFFNPVWKSFLFEIIRENEIKLIIVRDLPMAIAGITVGHKHKLPVLFDMAENYVAMLKDIWKYRKYKNLNFLVRNPWFGMMVEKYVLKKVDHILTVVDEAKELVISKGVESQRVTIVSNTPSQIFYEKSTNDPNEKLDFIRQKFAAIYIGGIQKGRGIQIVLNAIPIIIKKIPEFLFVIVGSGYAKKEMEDIITANNLQNFVFFVGWVEHKNLVKYIDVCRVGLIPHIVTEHKNTTVPNKLFDYMAFGLSVLASDAIPIKRILEEEKCGRTFRNGDVDDFVQKLEDIYYSKIDLGRNGREAVRKKYNWNVDSKRLFDVIKKFN